VDGVAVGLADPIERRELSSLVSPGVEDWAILRARSHGGGSLVVPTPATTYPEHDAVLYVDRRGAPALGFFRRLDDTMPPGVRRRLATPTAFLPDVVSVEVWTRPPPDAAPDDRVRVTLLGGGSPVEVRDADLAALARIEGRKAAPTGPEVSKRAKKKARFEGWALSSVVGLAVPPERVGSVVIVAGDSSRELPGELVRDPAPRAMLRLNRRGAMVLELLDGGATASPDRVRGVTTIEVREIVAP